MSKSRKKDSAEVVLGIRVGSLTKQLFGADKFLAPHEEHEKLSTLLMQYHISESNSEKWYELARYLARDYIKGFKPPKPRKVWWDEETERLLINHHLAYKLQFPNINDKEICAKLAERYPWKERLLTCGALQNRICRIKRKLRQEATLRIHAS